MTVLASAVGRTESSVADRTALAKARLAQVLATRPHGVLEWERPGPSAAFSRRDSLAPGFVDAVNSVRAAGFTPFIRPVGGRLAAYHDGALVLDLLVRSDDPRAGTQARFRAIAEALAAGLRRLYVDARVGEVPGEYCPGEWSVNAGGSRKLVGTGQRLARDGVLFTAVIVVGDPAPLAAVMGRAYADLGLGFDPRTVGAVSDSVPGITLDEVQEVLGTTLAERLALDGPDLVGGRALLQRWDPR